MKPLKTLDDLMEETQAGLFNEDFNVIHVGKLKAEAIKWVKEYRNLQEQCRKKGLSPIIYLGHELALTKFHNITEGDLK